MEERTVALPMPTVAAPACRIRLLEEIAVLYSRTDRRPLIVLASLLAVLAAATAPVGQRRAIAQPVDAATAVREAASALAGSGYSARFTSSLTESATAELRFQSPTAYSALVRDASGEAIEYILLDPDLYSRRQAATEAEWSAWRRQQWHPDAPMNGLTTFHPRLPLELLRGATDLRPAGLEETPGGALTRIDGGVSYVAALFAVYEDVPLAGVESTTWPVSVWLDSTGQVQRLELRVPPTGDEDFREAVLRFEFEHRAAPLILTAPAESTEVESALVQRAAPPGEARPLPVSLSGSGRVLATPLLSTTGGLNVTVNSPLPGLDYQVWRVKRGRLLVAAFGTVTGPGGTIRFSLPLPPGEYLIEMVLPSEAEVTITLEPMPETP